MKNIYGVEINPYEWQVDMKNHCKDNVFIIAPTGAGKSVAAYVWAFSCKAESRELKRIIFTAPIKALSNERYLELKGMNKDVGILTGDVKLNENAKILCITQEIYTNRFAGTPNQKVIIDEIQYMFQDKKRARSYVDGIVNTHKDSKIMCLSATVNPEVIGYFERISNRKFHTVYIDKKPVPLEIIGKITIDNIKEYTPAIIFLFSKKGVEITAENVASILEEINNEQKEKLEKLALKYRIKNSWLLKLANKGTGIYSGMMLFKEKVFMEKLVREQIIKVVVGTDALALGVNFPVKTVIFGQLAKYHNGPISKREFLQMTGRAGRPNLYNIGYVGYMNTQFENIAYKTEELFYGLLNSKIEKEKLLIQPDYRKIIHTLDYNHLNNTEMITQVVNEELNYIKNYSLLDEEDIDTHISNLQYVMENNLRETLNSIKSEKEYTTLRKIYFPEFDIYENIQAAKVLSENNDKLDAIAFFYCTAKGYDQKDMLQYLRFYNNLIDKGFLIENLDKFIEEIKSNDEFVLDPDKM